MRGGGGGGSKYYNKQAIIGFRCWPNIESWLGSFVGVFSGVWINIAKKPYISVIFQGGGGGSGSPALLWIRACYAGPNTKLAQACGFNERREKQALEFLNKACIHFMLFSFYVKYLNM